MAKMKLKRPTKEMMLAVNASIAGNQKEVNSLLTEFKLNKQELAARLDKRQGERYDLTPKPRGPKAAKASAADIAASIDGRTSTVNLLRLEARLKELLAEKPKADLTKVRNALGNYDKKREELEDMEALLGL